MKFDDNDPAQLRRVLYSAISRKNVWKNRCAVGWTLALVSSVAALFFALRTPVPTPAPSAKTPNRVLASVWFNGCSGTFVSKGEVGRILCCGHAFGQVGQEVEFYRADGRTGRARVIRIDFQRELSELVCNAADVLAVTPVPEDLGETTIGEVSNKSYSICGYPDGVGPTLHSLGRPYLSAVHEARSEVPQPAWQFKHSDSGNAWYGSSGCGIFADDYLISVQSNILPDDGGKTVYGCPHPELVKFLRTSKRKDCGNGLCPAPQSWKPRPNVPIEVNGETAPPAYGGKGKPPEDLASCKALAAAIDKLRSEMTVLEKQVATLQKEWQEMRDTVPPPPDDTAPAPAPRGPQGPAGPPGPAADLSGINAQISALQTQIAGVVSGLGSRGQQGPGAPGIDPALFRQIQSDVEGLKLFKQNLIGSKVTVPVK